MKDLSRTTGPVELLVCVKCRRDGADADDRRPGAVLLDALDRAETPRDVRITPVECLQNCEAGCTVALRGPGRWTYVYGNLDPSQAADLLDGAARFRDTEDGLIPWRERPEHFKRNCVARVPPPTESEDPNG